MQTQTVYSSPTPPCCFTDAPRGVLGLEHDVGAPLRAGAAAGGVVLIQLAVADGQGRVLVTVVD